MKLAFVHKQFSQEHRGIINLANEIIESYQSQGYKLSLRQLYYQMVARNVIENTERSYKRIGSIIADARMAGLCDWEMIEDRARETITPPHWNSPAEIVETCVHAYRRDPWQTQPNYCEVMVEKQALEGILEPVCRKLSVPFTANKGYSSVSMMYETGQRLQKKFFERTKKIIPKILHSKRFFHAGKWLLDNGLTTNRGQVTDKGRAEGIPRMVVFYLGDHDPSGIDMTRDVDQRLYLFSELVPVEVQRLALNMEQIEELQPPENPAKLTDSRANKYISNYGHSSWELDAVEPSAMASMVQNAINDLIDEDAWVKNMRQQDREISKLKKAVKNLK